MNQEKRPITLEDIIRLKRAERPPAEFWESFDRELRAKQLAALVEKRPWWRSMPRAFAGFSFARYHLPLGAAAALAITFIATRDDRPALQSAEPVPVAKITVENSAAGTVATSLAPAVVTPEILHAAAMAVATDEASAVRTDAAVTNASLETVDEAEPVMPSRRELLDTPSSRFIAENLKAAQAAEPAVARGLLSRAHGFEVRGLSARANNIEPLAQMTTPAEARRAKFNSPLLNASFTADADDSARTSERVASRLSDKRIYDSGASRFRANGDVRGFGLGTKL